MKSRLIAAFAGKNRDFKIYLSKMRKGNSGIVMGDKGVIGLFGAGAAGRTFSAQDGGIKHG